MERNPAENDEVVSQFCAMTGTRPAEAQEYLAANGWDIEAAVTEFFAEQDEAMQGANTVGGRSLGGADSAASAGQSLGGSSSQSGTATPQQSSSSSRKPTSKKRFATLGDFASGGGDSSDEDDTENQDFFAGGEKSGLAVQNPDDLKRKIIEKARK
jgi:UBX domain-containing protein 1